MYLFSSFDVDVERIRGHPPLATQDTKHVSIPVKIFIFFSFLEPIMDVFKAFPMINYKSECPMYSFTSENV